MTTLLSIQKEGATVMNPSLLVTLVEHGVMSDKMREERKKKSCGTVQAFSHDKHTPLSRLSRNSESRGFFRTSSLSCRHDYFVRRHHSIPLPLSPSLIVCVTENSLWRHLQTLAQRHPLCCSRESVGQHLELLQLPPPPPLRLQTPLLDHREHLTAYQLQQATAQIAIRMVMHLAPS